MDIVKLKPSIKHYDWGTTDYLSHLFQFPSSGEPSAEAWFGSHAGGPALVEGLDIDLAAFLKNNPSWYGKQTLAAFGGKLPLLFKVLSIQKPLSIQCHPTTEQAREGYEKELPLHATLPQSEWNYKDPFRKAEILCALTPVTAMCGFRHFSQIDSSFHKLVPFSYRSYLADVFHQAPQALKDNDDVMGDQLTAQLFQRLYTLDEKALASCVRELLESLRIARELKTVSEDGLFLEAKGIIQQAVKEYPVDAGLFAPLLLNILHLHPGQAVYLEPRTLHAYVQGNGVELMSASDNVLRGGLTHKKMDVPELMKVMRVAGWQPSTVPTDTDAFGRSRFLTPVNEFELLLDSTGNYTVGQRFGLEMALCTQGHAVLRTRNGEVRLGTGECALVSGALDTYSLAVEGQVFFASIPSQEN